MITTDGLCTLYYSILAANEYALRMLESEASKPSDGTTGFLQSNWLWSWGPSTDAGSDTQQVVTTTFQDVMNLFVT